MKKILATLFILCQASCQPLPAADHIPDAGFNTNPVTTITVPAPIVNVATPAPTIHIDAPDLSQIKAPTINVPAPDLSQIKPTVVNVPPAKTDWDALFAQLGAAAAAVAALVGSIMGLLSQHRTKQEASDDWKDLLAWGLNQAKGDGLQRIKSAVELVRQRYRSMKGTDLTQTDMLDVENGIHALHVATAGLVVHDAVAERNQEEIDDMASKLKAAGYRVVPLALVMVACFLSGCFSGTPQRKQAEQSEYDITKAGNANDDLQFDKHELALKQERYAHIQLELDAGIAQVQALSVQNPAVYTPVKCATEISRQQALASQRRADFDALQVQNRALHQKNIDTNRAAVAKIANTLNAPKVPMTPTNLSAQINTVGGTPSTAPASLINP